MASNLGARRGVSPCSALCVQVAADPQDALQCSRLFHGRAKRASLSVKSSCVEQGGVFRLASVVLSVTTDARPALAGICRAPSPPPQGAFNARAYKIYLIY